MAMKTTSASRNFFRLTSLAAVLSFGAAVSYAQQQAPSPGDSGPDPALANMAPADAAAMQQNAPAGQADDPQSFGQQNLGGLPPQQAPAPIVRSTASAQAGTAQAGEPDDSYNAPPSVDNDEGTDPQTDAQVDAGQQALDDANISSDQPPPPLPDYDQPDAPGDNYLWTPGYWGYGGTGYYWVPGAWAVPPYYGALWTPCYWGWYEGRYRWHPGYWGLHVGFYGGVDYGYGYIGTGYFGGYWHGNAFLYNRAVTHVGVGVGFDHVYSRTVVYNHTTYGPQPTSRISYNGGRGGLNVAPRPAEFAAMHESHTGPLAGQMGLRTSAAHNPQAAFSNNHGHPAVAAQQQPIGVNRPIANTPSEFHQRQQQSPLAPQYRQPNPQPRPQQQPRAQPQQRQSPPPRQPAARSAPPARESNSSKH